MLPALDQFFYENGFISAREYRVAAIEGDAPYSLRQVIRTFGTYLRATHWVRRAWDSSPVRGVGSRGDVQVKVVPASTMYKPMRYEFAGRGEIELGANGVPVYEAA